MEEEKWPSEASFLASFSAMRAPYFIGTICIHNDGGGEEHGDDGDVSLAEDSKLKPPFSCFGVRAVPGV